MKTTSLVLSATELFVRNHLEGSEPGHDWSHVQRVYNTAMLLSARLEADTFVVALASLLHDVGDAKFHDGDETIGPELIKSFLHSQEIEESVFKEVMYIIENMSFRKSSYFQNEKSLEFKIVQDADRLDSIGAIGIARAFSFGGYKRRPFHVPGLVYDEDNKSVTYQSGKSPTIYHFYEKLLLIKDMMNTAPAREMAEQRHQYMLDFLEQFYKEWEGL